MKTYSSPLCYQSLYNDYNNDGASNKLTPNVVTMRIYNMMLELNINIVSTTDANAISPATITMTARSYASYFAVIDGELFAVDLNDVPTNSPVPFLANSCLVLFLLYEFLYVTTNIIQYYTSKILLLSRLFKLIHHHLINYCWIIIHC